MLLFGNGAAAGEGRGGWPPSGGPPPPTPAIKHTPPVLTRTLAVVRDGKKHARAPVSPWAPRMPACPHRHAAHWKEREKKEGRRMRSIPNPTPNPSAALSSLEGAGAGSFHMWIRKTSFLRLTASFCFSCCCVRAYGRGRGCVRRQPPVYPRLCFPPQTLRLPQTRKEREREEHGQRTRLMSFLHFN